MAEVSLSAVVISGRLSNSFSVVKALCLGNFGYAIEPEPQFERAWVQVSEDGNQREKHILTLH